MIGGGGVVGHGMGGVGWGERAVRTAARGCSHLLKGVECWRVWYGRGVGVSGFGMGSGRSWLGMVG